MSQAVEVTAIDEQPRKEKTNLLGLSASRIGDFLESLGEKRFRGTQILKWIHQQGVTDINEMTNISKGLRASLAKWLKSFCQRWSVFRIRLMALANG